MYRWLAQTLGNVSVNKKLGFGFGLVLLLTLLITATGWMGLGSVIERGDKLGYISSLNELTKDLRAARLDYEMRRGEQGPGRSATCSSSSTAACRLHAACWSNPTA